MHEYEEELAKEIKRVWKLGVWNRENVADPETNSCPRVWHDHVDPDINPYEVSFLCTANFPL